MVDERTDQEPKSHGSNPTNAPNPWALRRIELECFKMAQDAAMDHQQRAAACFAEYQQALKQVAEETSTAAFAALESAEADSSAPDVTAERSGEIIRTYRERVAELHRKATSQVLDAAKRLAEDQQRSWLNTVEKHQAAYARYFDMAARVAPVGGPGLPSPFAVAGDEGVAGFDFWMPMGASWTGPSAGPGGV